MRNLLIVLLVMLAGYSQAVDKVWTNGVPTGGWAWGTAGNWSPSGVPTANDTVIFTNSKSGGNLTVTLGADRSCSNMVFTSTNLYTISGGTLTVNGTISNLQSTAKKISISTVTMENERTLYNAGQMSFPQALTINNAVTWVNIGSNFVESLVANAPITLIGNGTNILSYINFYSGMTNFVFSGDTWVGAFGEEDSYPNITFNGTTTIDAFSFSGNELVWNINGTLNTTNAVEYFINNGAYNSIININSGAVWRADNEVDRANTVCSYYLKTLNMATNSTLYLGAYGGTPGNLICDAFFLAPDTPPQMDGTINVTLANTDDWDWNYGLGSDVMPLFNTVYGQLFTNNPTIVINPASDGELAGASFTVLPYHVPGMPYLSGGYRAYIYEDTTSATNSYGTALRFYQGSYYFVLVLEKQTKQAKPWMGWMMNQ